MKKNNTHTTDKEVNGFTPGEWEFEQIRGNNYYEHYVFSRNSGKYGSYVIAQLGMNKEEKEPEEIKANAALIASAPRLKAENEKLLSDVKVLREALKSVLGYEKRGADKGEPRIGNGILSIIHKVLNQTK